MDINLLRSVITVISLLLFLALVVWTYTRSRRSAFDVAARLPLDEEGQREPEAVDEARPGRAS